MKIRQITNYPRLDLNQGDIIDWDDAESERMIANGLVERVDPEPAEPTVERAVKPKAKETR